MTIEQILECPLEELKAMDEVTLLKHFEPFLKVTRPELASKNIDPFKKMKKSASSNQKYEAVLARARQLGLDV